MTIHHVFYSSDAPPGRYVAVVLYSFIKVIQTKGSGVILVDRLIPLLTPLGYCYSQVSRGVCLSVAQYFEGHKNIDIFTDNTHVVEFSCADTVCQPINGNPAIEPRHVSSFLGRMFFDAL